MNQQRKISTQTMAALLASALVTGCAVRPVPVTDAQKETRMQGDLAQLFAGQAALAAPIDMYDAMARAIQYNLDHRVKLMEQAVAAGAEDLSRYAMLPALTAGGGYFNRSNDSGASSRSLITDTQSLEPSTSQDKERSTVGLNMAWNVLDFGVSYAQAQQKANETLLHQEQLRKVTNDIVEEVRSKFWRALAAQQLLPEMDDLLERTEGALRRSREMEDLRIEDPMKALNYQQSLLKIIGQMWKVRKELTSAKSELAALINLEPGTDFKLTDSGVAEASALRRVQIPLSNLETMAITHRPELGEADYKARMDVLEVRVAMLRMLPGLELDVGQNYDSNSYLFNSSWAEASLRVSWNLMKIFSGPASIKHAETLQELGEARRLALSMAVLTQVNVSFHNYHLALKSQEITTQQYEVEARILEQTLAQQMATRESELDGLKARASALSSKMSKQLAEADTQNAIGRLIGAVGIDPLPDGVVYGEDLDTLANAIETHVNGWVEKLESGGDGATITPSGAIAVP